MSSGLLLDEPRNGADTSVANPPATVQSGEDFTGADPILTTLGHSDPVSTADWIDIYKRRPMTETPVGRPGQAVHRSRSARAKVRSAPARHRLEKSRRRDGDGRTSRYSPHVLVLEQLSGKTSTLALTVQADMVTNRPSFRWNAISARLGECGRHRFTLNDEKRTDMLFQGGPSIARSCAERSRPACCHQQRRDRRGMRASTSTPSVSCLANKQHRDTVYRATRKDAARARSRQKIMSLTIFLSISPIAFSSLPS